MIRSLGVEPHKLTHFRRFARIGDETREMKTFVQRTIKKSWGDTMLAHSGIGKVRVLDNERCDRGGRVGGRLRGRLS